MGLKIILFFIFILLNLIVYIFTDIDKNERIDTALKTHNNKLKTDFETLEFHQENLAQLVHEYIEPVVTDIYTRVYNSSEQDINKLRKELHVKLKTVYDTIKEEGVYQFHFVLNDNTTFFRFHKPDKYGDSIDDIRYTYQYVKENKEHIHGLEKGKTIHAFRHVFPVLDAEKNYLGAYEISFTSEHLQWYLSSITKHHTHFLIRKDIVNQSVWKKIDSTYTESSENENYMLVLEREVADRNIHLVKNKIKLQPYHEEIAAKMNQGKPFGLYTYVNDGEDIEVVSFYPIKNAANNDYIAWIISYEKDEVIYKTLLNHSRIEVVFFIFFAILLYFVYRVLSQKSDLQKIVEERTYKLQKSETFLLNIMNSVVDAIISIDERGIIQTFNDAAEKLYGYDRSEVIGKNIKIIVPEPDRSQHDTYLENYLRTGIKKAIGKVIERESIRKDGTAVLSSIRIGEINVNNTRTFTALIQDITKRKADEQLLIDARDKAEKALNAKSEFLANMSHEIRTPMNAIIGLTFLLEQSDLDDKQVEYVQKVDNAAKHLLGIINDILDYSKIEAGKMKLEHAAFNFRDILNNISDIFAFKIKDKDIELLYDIDDDMPDKLIGDSLRLSQIFINIIGNAIKFTEKGVVVLRTRVLEIKGENAHIEFSVSDTGIGMTQEHVENIFSTYSQADSSTTRKFGGTGLGLAISQYLVKEMKGSSFDVKSEMDVGTTFKFDICLELQKEQSPLKNHRVNILKVLIVDDNEVSLEIMYKMSKSIGYDTVKSNNSFEAVKLVKDASLEKKPFDLLILDYKMPGMNGFDVIDELHNNIEAEELPKIIMVTSTDVNLLKSNDKKNRVDGFLTKPLSQSSFYDMSVRLFHDNDEPIFEESDTKLENSYKSYLGKVSGAHILLVEDNEQNQEIAEEYLKKGNMTIDIANNGQEAIEKISANKYDAVLMDCQMPVMDGYESTKRIRTIKDDNISTIPIIAMTANAMQGDREKCIMSGMDDYISKPIDINKMFYTLSKWIDIKQTEDVEYIQEDGVIEYSKYEKLGLDAKDAIARMGNDEDFYMSQLQKFSKSHKNFKTSIDAQFEQEEQETLVRSFHTLKGLCGNIGAKDLQLRAKELESMLKEEVTPRAKELAGKIIEDLNVLSEKLDDFVAQNTKKSVEAVLDDDTYKSKLENLRTLLDDFDASAMDTFKEIKSTMCEKGYEKQSGEIEELIEEFEYEEALKVLMKI